MRTYMVVRYYQNAEPEVIERGLTLVEARLHCADPETRGFEPGRGRWFDGYTEEP